MTEGKAEWGYRTRAGMTAGEAKCGYVIKLRGNDGRKGGMRLRTCENAAGEAEWGYRTRTRMTAAFRTATMQLP